MVMSVNRFYSDFKAIKMFVEDNPGTADDLKKALSLVMESFKNAYSSESFKEALYSNANIPDDLEENFTSAVIIYKREKALL